MPGFPLRRTYSSAPFNYIKGVCQRRNVDAIPEKSRKFLKFFASLPRVHRQSSIGAAKLWKSNRSFQLLKHHYAIHVDECKPKREMTHPVLARFGPLKTAELPGMLSPKPWRFSPFHSRGLSLHQIRPLLNLVRTQSAVAEGIGREPTWAA
jgi:hypothetical protein